MAVEPQRKGEEAADELGAWIINQAGAIRRGETLAGRSTDHPGRDEVGAMVAVHVGEPYRAKVGEIATFCAGAVGVPGGDRIRTDVICQADGEARALEAKV